MQASARTFVGVPVVAHGVSRQREMASILQYVSSEAESGRWQASRLGWSSMIHIQIHEGDRADLLPLFRIADESESEILSYYELGDVLVAWDGDMIVGMAHVEKDGNTVQIISLAVVEPRQGQGIGSRLIEEAASYCQRNGAKRLIVCTGAWEAENIVFYTRRGFRLFHVERGFFTPEKGYAELGDQVQFEMAV